MFSPLKKSSGSRDSPSKNNQNSTLGSPRKISIQRSASFGNSFQTSPSPKNLRTLSRTESSPSSLSFVVPQSSSKSAFGSSLPSKVPIKSSPALSPSQSAVKYAARPSNVSQPTSFSKFDGIPSNESLSKNVNELSFDDSMKSQNDRDLPNTEEQILETQLLQILYMKKRLEETSEREKDKSEIELLRFWQLVYDAEEEESALSDKFCMMSEIIKTHNLLKSIVS